VESFGPLGAIVWAQWRTSRNFYLRAHKGGVVFKWLMGLLWYGMWALGAAGAGFLVSGRIPMAIVERALPGALFLIGFFWQLFPIILASQGAFLDMRRLLVYPIPDSQLFLLETVLRITTAIEMMLVSVGLMIGLLFNREVPLWGPLAIVVFMALNLLLATGTKSLLDRLFKKKGVRELLMVVFLGLILVPQFFAASLQDGATPQFQWFQKFGPLFRATPWSAAARLALGQVSGLAVASLAACTSLAYLFARMQFARSLQLEEDTGSATDKPEKSGATWLDHIARWPSAFLLDPVAALVEKDIRSLVRAPRFRLIFLVASTFGAAVWLPQVMRSREGWMAQNYVTMATLYGMLVLGEVLYWNVFGFERASVQQWFVTPVRFADVLRAKNVVAVLYTLLAVAILSGVAAVLPVGVGLPQLLDALAAVSVFLLCTMAAGNLTSVYMPRPIDAQQAWRNNSGKTQFLVLFVYPLLTVPVALAHLARWATGSYWAYHGVLGVSFIIALCFYTVATETAEEVAEERKEQIVAALSQQEGPVALGT
jgi:ABC-2 type transport system permease protein